MPGSHVLVIDDDERCSSSLKDWLTGDGFVVTAVGRGRAGLLHAGPVDVVLLDYKLPDIDGFEVLRRLSARDPSVPVIMMTGHASVEHAVEAMKCGAFHYVVKPVGLASVAECVREALVVSAARKRVSGEATDADPCAPIIGVSKKIAAVRTMIGKLGRSGATVLITGESGTGKNLAARALHRTSPRAAGPFTNITCTALPTTLLESELFGYERGAFTDAKARRRGLLEQAAGGTVFLDEIGDMEPVLQAKLLRVLEEKRFRRVGGNEDLVADVRVLATTNVDLMAAVASKDFREDLYYRLAVLKLHIPPLRERREDIEPLVTHFVAQACLELGVAERRVSDAAMRELTTHAWPGNVRELRNVVERAVLLADGDAIEPADLQLAGGGGDARAPQLALPPGGVDVRHLERELVEQALERTAGNATHAGRLLGMSRDQIRYRVSKFGLNAGRPDSESDPDSDPAPHT